MCGGIAGPPMEDDSSGSYYYNTPVRRESTRNKNKGGMKKECPKCGQINPTNTECWKCGRYN